MNTQSQANEYLNDPGESAGALSSTALFFLGDKMLAPFSLDLRTVWMALADDSDHSNFTAAALVWLCLTAREAFDKAVALGVKDSELCWDYVATTILTETKVKSAARVKVMRFIRELGTQAAIREVLKLAVKIIEHAEQSEPESAASATDATAEAVAQAGKVRRSGSRAKKK